jgi:broad specificity phosphatase PhoE
MRAFYLLSVLSALASARADAILPPNEPVNPEVLAELETLKGHLQVCNVKTVHFVRHGLALHNIASRGCDDEKVFDSPLVSFGVTQAEDLGMELAMAVQVDAIISSPLRRTLQTASYLRAALAAQNALSAHGLSAVDVFVIEDAREHYTRCTDSMRTNTSAAKSLFPDFVFDSFVHENDPFRFLDGGGDGQYEDHGALNVRAARFVRALGDRAEAHIVVVSHVSFIWRSIDQALKQGWVLIVPALPARIVYDRGPHFANCQVSSYEPRSC